jgi:hypothetical protein
MCPTKRSLTFGGASPRRAGPRGRAAADHHARLAWLGDRAARGRQSAHRSGRTRYVAQGGDQGAAVTDAMGRQAPAGLLGIHLEERAALAVINTFRTSGSAYFLEQATRPQTIGYALLDSPAALAAWMLDHDTDSYYKISRAFLEGQLPAGLTAFPGEIFQAPRSWAEKVYPHVIYFHIYFNEAERGGHFAAWEQPQLLSEELREAFRTLR